MRKEALMKPHQGPKLPLISARGSLSARDMPASVREQESSRSHGGDAHKFNKLKGVLVNNLLKYYYKQTQRQGDGKVYARAVEEVERILQHGKLQEKHLKELQQRFSNGIGIDVEETAPRAQTAQNSTQRTLPGDDSVSAHPTGGLAGDAASASNAQQHAPTNGSPSKKQRKVDEWSVMTLYDDVRHFEQQKNLKDKKLQDQSRTRSELLGQMNIRQLMKEESRAAERQAADEQRRRYESWQQEKDILQQRKLDKMAAERLRAAQAREALDFEKKTLAERKLQEEHRALDGFKEQIEQEKRVKQQQQQEKKQQYDAVLIENARELERKRLLKAKEREEDARLFQVQIEMAEKQEQQRRKREEERQRKLQAAERMAEIQGNNAAELERQVEERVRVAQDELRQREIEKERTKRELKAKTTSEQMSVLQVQIAALEAQRERAKADERARAIDMQREAEAFEKEQIMKKVAKKERQAQNRRDLDQQRAHQLMHSQHSSGMSEIELRINKSILQQVIADEALQRELKELPPEMASKLAINQAAEATEVGRTKGPSNPF